MTLKYDVGHEVDGIVKCLIIAKMQWYLISIIKVRIANKLSLSYEYNLFIREFFKRNLNEVDEIKKYILQNQRDFINEIINLRIK